MRNTKGILIGSSHAVTWEDPYYYDPADGNKKENMNITFHEYWRMEDLT